MQDLKDRICAFYEVEEEEREHVCDSVESFVLFCTKKDILNFHNK